MTKFRAFVSSRRFNLIALFGLLVLLSVFSIQSAPIVAASSTAQAARQVDVTLTEWDIVPENVQFQAGETVIFNIINEGDFPHSLEVSNSAIHLHSDTIDSGETTSMEVTFEYGGAYGWLCPIPGHADLGMTGSLDVQGGTPAPDTGEYLGTPLMRVNPRSDTEVEGDSQEISVILHDFTLAPEDIGGANTPGEGHWALFLDGQLVASVGEPTYILEDLSPGTHTVRAELRNNDGTPLDPPVEDSTTLQVSQSQSTIAVPPGVGDIAPGGWMLAGGTAIGTLLLGTGALVLVRRRL
jgi:uncharacterized cupredoxin-like copper-binding protein